MTVEALLRGGPEDGKRVAVEGDTITATFMWPLKMPPPRPPRPKWWRQPRAWWRWRKWVPPEMPPPRMDLLTWRRTGERADGAFVYVLTSPWEPWRSAVTVEPGAPNDEIMRALYTVTGYAHPIIRQDAHTQWVMGPAWYYRLRQIALPHEPPPDPGGAFREPVPQLLGLPVKVIESDQPPALENVTKPAAWPGW